MKPLTRLTLLLCLLVLPLTACIPKFGEDSGPQYVRTYYIDVLNGFAIEYPADWIKAGKTPSSVAWQPPPGTDGATETMATVTSLFPSEVPGGDDRMLDDFMAVHPGFVLSSKEVIAHPEAAPALQVLGQTPTRAFLALFITARHRAFVLEFSASPQWFDSFHPIFEEMADSFRVLD